MPGRHKKWYEIWLVNSRYNLRAVAQFDSVYVKKGKKKPDAKHPVEIGVNRHSELNDGNK